MRAGVTGHQKRPGIDWTWVSGSLRQALEGLQPVERLYTCLAAGADQAAAEVALALDIPITTVIPMPDYERLYAVAGLAEYRRLKRRGEVLQLPGDPDDEAAFMAASLKVVDASDVLLAVWDGRAARGFGGTGDVVSHALGAGRRVIHIDTTTRRVMELPLPKATGGANS